MLVLHLLVYNFFKHYFFKNRTTNLGLRKYFNREVCEVNQRHHILFKRSAQFLYKKNTSVCEIVLEIKTYQYICLIVVSLICRLIVN